MLKRIAATFFIICLIYFIQHKAVSYDDFGGRYKYNQYGSMPNSSYYSGMEEEEILLIVDFSESMNKSFGMSSRYIHAIDAINQIIRELPSSTRIGLRVFGVSTQTLNGFGVNLNKNYSKEELCSATKLVIPISSNNTSNISNTLSSFTPNGVTPIGYSLRQAIKNDFNIPSSLKHIILVTDGRENCGDDPCQYIKRVMSTRNDIKIDVIGITIDENAYSQLACIANNANGKYFDVKNPQDMKLTFKSAFSNIPPKYSQPEEKLKTELQNTKVNDRTKYSNYSFEFDM